MAAFIQGPNPLYQSASEMALTIPGWLIKHGSHLKYAKNFVRLFTIPIDEYLAGFIRDEHLIRFLAVGYRGTPAAFSMTFFYAMTDYYYPDKGGMQALSDLLAQYIVDRGGDIRYNTGVEKIVVENGRAKGVLLNGGEKIFAPYVVNNSDARRTCSELLPPKAVPKEYRQRLEKSVVGESAFSVYLGVDIPPEKLPTKSCPHLLYKPSYEPVDIEEIDSHPDFYRHTLIMISLPSLFDRTLAPPGKSIIILQCAATIRSMNHWGTQKGKRTKKYRAVKKRIAAQLIQNVERIIPGLSKKIDLQIESTPYTLRDYTFNAEGAAVGWTYHPREAFKGGVKGIFGQGNTPVKNLYQVGHWTMSPGGAPAGLVSGKLVGNAIRYRLRLGI